MQKILVINGHPNPEASVAGKAVLNTLESIPLRDANQNVGAVVRSQRF